MRATHTVGVIAGAVFALASASCADALRLEPTGGAGGGNPSGTPASTSVGGGSGGAIACVSSSDCPQPTGVCDVVKGVCVACLELDDCAAQPGTVCDAGVCACPGEGESYCDEARGCFDLQTSADHCGACDQGCFGACAAGSCVGPWTRVQDVNAPEARGWHAAAFVAGEMFVWGGSRSSGSTDNLNDGGRYDPATNTWSALSPVGAPSKRQRATAVSTGSLVIVWGGRDGNAYPVAGGVYDPATDTWAPMTDAGAPDGRMQHTAVWTGSEMVVFGGNNATSSSLADGGAYDPATDTWRPLAAVPSPGESRTRHAAAWDAAAGEMVVVGGQGTYASFGTLVFPAGSAPSARAYDPSLDTWRVLSIMGQPTPRESHTVVAVGGEVLVFGGRDTSTELDTGFRFASGVWTTLAGDPPAARREHTATVLADAGKVVVFGGRTTSLGSTVDLDDGGVYDLATNAWDATVVPTAVGPRFGHTAVSAGATMIVWGGFGPNALATGGVFTP
ncbi:MAG: kelch repeat-containing protein [Myxococcota bacterium]